MKKLFIILLIFQSTILLFAGNKIYREYGYDYISPLPGSSRISPQNNIVIKYKRPLERQKIRNSFLTVTGSKSGSHNGNLILSDDHRTLVFKPFTSFELGETVSVKLNKGSFSRDGDKLREFSFQFKISNYHQIKKYNSIENILGNLKQAQININLEKINNGKVDSLPIGFPNLNITISNNPSDGYFFLSPFNYPSNKNNYLIIADNAGVPMFYRKMGTRCYDFKVQSTGVLTYYDEGVHKFYALNSSYTIIDSFACGNGYITDLHDLNILPNGHALLLGIEVLPFRMDTIVAGGDSNAMVTGLIVQELDNEKNVVFQWRSFDHYKVTDAVGVDLTDSVIDYVHANAVEMDGDGNLLISARHMDEITKIDRNSGDIIWRLGGKNNQYTFTNDNDQFSHQHDIRRLPNGNISLFDNGNFHSPNFSRALEYSLNDSLKTATLVWEYRHNPDFYSVAMGSNRKLPNGNRIIGWGFKGENNPDISEVTDDGDISFEAYLPDTMYSYRAFKFNWRTNLFTASSYNVGFGNVPLGDSASLSITIKNNSPNEISITKFYNKNKIFSVEKNTPFIIQSGEEIPLGIKYKPDSSFIGSIYDTLYIISEKPGERIAQIINLSGETIVSIDNEESQPLKFELSQNYPNPFNPSTIIHYSIPKSNLVSLKVYDVLGKEISTLVNEEKPFGKYEVEFNGNGLPSGIYFYQIHAGSYSSVKKMILLK